MEHMGKGIPGSIIDILLLLRHFFHIFLKGDQLFFLSGIIQQQILQKVLVHAVHGVYPVLDGLGKSLIEGLILIPLRSQHLQQLALDLLFQIIGNGRKLPVILEHLPGDVQRQVRGIHQSLHKAEIFGQQLLAFVHDHHAVAVQPQPPLEALGKEIIGRFFGDIQQSRVGKGSFGLDVQHGKRILHIIEGILIEAVVLFFGNLALVPAPQGHHAVEHRILHNGFILRLILGTVLLGDALFLHHADGVADIVAVLLYQRGKGIGLEEAAVLFAFLILLQGQNDLSAHSGIVKGLYGIAVLPGTFPHMALAVHRAGVYLYVFCHHKGGIKAHAKLADHIQLRLFILLHSLLKSPCAGFGNGAQVALQFFLAHAAAVIGNGQGAGSFVGGETDKIFAPVQAGVSALHGGVIPLINGIGSIADQLPQKDLLVGVDGVYHQVQKPLAFRFELFFGHGIDRLSLNLALSYMEC